MNTEVSSFAGGGVRRDVVVIGASAGGVKALRSLVGQLPARLPASVLVVLHVGHHASMLPDILSRSGANPALPARDGEPLQHGRILVAPPDHHLMVDAHGLRVTRGAKEHHTRPAIDPLFRSAALALGPRVIGVLLSGRLDDGTAGLQAIKDCGGLALVQAPQDADEPGMPKSAIRHVDVDEVLPVHRMGARIAELVGEPAPAVAAPPEALAIENEVAGVLAPAADLAQPLERIGRLSTFVCPDCGGPLWHIHGSEPARYRCHTGHGFSLKSLDLAQAEATDNALWSAIRVLTERELLLRELAGVDDGPASAAALAEAARIAGQARLLGELVMPAGRRLAPGDS